MPPVAAAMTSFTWMLSSLLSWLLSALRTLSEIDLRYPIGGMHDSSLKMSRTFSYMSAWSSAKPV